TSGETRRRVDGIEKSVHEIPGSRLRAPRNDSRCKDQFTARKSPVPTPTVRDCPAGAEHWPVAAAIAAYFQKSPAVQVQWIEPDAAFSASAARRVPLPLPPAKRMPMEFRPSPVRV